MTEHNPAEQQMSTLQGGGLGDLIEDHPRAATVIGVAIIVTCTLLAYLPAIRGGFVWDDDFYVTNNELLRSWQGLQRIWTDVLPHPADYPLPQYYPMTHTSFWLEYRFFGDSPMGYHIDNVILHILNALLIWLILRKLDIPGAWLAAAIFALHPINVESAAWIAERKNVLCLLFFLSSLYVYLRFAGIIRSLRRNTESTAQAPQQSSEPQIDWASLPDDPIRLFALALILFLCALFSKTITNSLPAVALLIIWWKRGRVAVRDVFFLLPFFAAGMVMGMLTAHMEFVRVGIQSRPEPWIYSTTAFGQFAAKCIIAGRALWFYVGKLIFPFPLIFNYARWQIDPSKPLQYFYPIAALAALAAVVLYRKQFGRGVVVAVLFYSGTLFPALGFINVWPMQYSFVANHFAYISLIGLMVLVVAIARRYLKLEMLAGIAVILIGLMMFRTVNESRVFGSPKKLWEDTLIKTDQKSWFAANNYGSWILDDGPNPDLGVRCDDAEKWFKWVIKLKPDHTEARYNLALVAERRAYLAEQQSSAMPPATTAPSTNPSRTLLSADEYYRQAIGYYRQAIDIDPKYVDAHFRLARRLLAMGDEKGANDHLKKVIELYPRHAQAHDLLGSIAYNKGDLHGAAAEFAQVVQIEPDSATAHVRLGTVMLEMGNALGVAEWSRAVEVDPDHAVELFNEFGVRMASSGRYAEAAQYFKLALERDRSSVETWTNMGVAAAKAGFPEQAKANFQEALKINSEYSKALENLEALRDGRLKPATTQVTTAPAVR